MPIKYTARVIKEKKVEISGVWNFNFVFFVASSLSDDVV